MSNDSKISATFRRRLVPPGSLRVWAVCVVLVNLWAFVNLFREAPALRLRLSIWDIIGTISYVLLFALIESGLVLLAVLLLAAVLPARALRAHFAARGSALVFVTSIWSVAIHYLQPAENWSWPDALLWLALYGVALAMLFALLPRFGWLERKIDSLAGSLVVLATFYGLFGMLALGIVVLRNL